MSTLDRAIQIAAKAHENQKDRYGQTYILHPLKLMEEMDTITEKIVAILHDVIEDSDWTLGNLRREKFSEEIVVAVDCLTRRESEHYMDYIGRLRKNPLARKVKLADLEHNMNLTRLDQITETDFERMIRYHKSWIILKNEEKG